MAFNLEQWKETTKQKLQGWKERFQHGGINVLYYGLAATSLLPAVQAYHTGDVAPALLALGSVSAGLGANLLANKIQGWKDKSEAEIATDLQNAPDLKEVIDSVLEKIETISSAQEDLKSDLDRKWFEEKLHEEIQKIGSRISFHATLIGNGAIAQGHRAKAVGAGGIMIGGNVSGNIVMGNNNSINDEKKKKK